MQNQIEIFQGKNNEINVEVKFEEDTVWLTQAQTLCNINRNLLFTWTQFIYIYDS